MPISREFLIREFEKIANNLEDEVSVYFIGGCALSLLDVKSSTYDADIIIETPNEMQRFSNACEKSGYTSKFQVSAEHKPLYPGKMYDNLQNQLHIDIFNKLVVGKLRLTPTMKERAKKFADLGNGNLHMYTCSKEDIFLFKSLASLARSRDLEDMELLYIAGLDWNIIRTEIIYQSENFNSRLSIYFMERMQDFQSKKEITIPKEYLQEIDKLAEKNELEEFVKSYISEKKTDEEIIKALADIYNQEMIISVIKKQRSDLQK